MVDQNYDRDTRRAAWPNAGMRGAEGIRPLLRHHRARHSRDSNSTPVDQRFAPSRKRPGGDPAAELRRVGVLAVAVHRLVTTFAAEVG